jgi:hypothetical protein
MEEKIPFHPRQGCAAGSSTVLAFANRRHDGAGRCNDNNGGSPGRYQHRLMQNDAGLHMGLATAPHITIIGGFVYRNF